MKVICAERYFLLTFVLTEHNNLKHYKGHNMYTDVLLDVSLVHVMVYK